MNDTKNAIHFEIKTHNFYYKIKIKWFTSKATISINRLHIYMYTTCNTRAVRKVSISQTAVIFIHLNKLVYCCIGESFINFVKRIMVYNLTCKKNFVSKTTYVTHYGAL